VQGALDCGHVRGNQKFFDGVRFSGQISGQGFDLSQSVNKASKD
jgi:hypothetical protein